MTKSILLALVSGAAAASLRRSAATLRSADLDDSIPFCQFGARGSFNGSVAVYIDADNSRSFSFGVDDDGTQTQVTCKGGTPQNCQGPRPTKAEDAPDCQDLGCDCDVDASTLQFGYMKKMMQEAQPMCEMPRTDGTPFRAMMIGLGGGALPEYLLQHCPTGTRVESVEYDPRVIDVATNFLGFHLKSGINEVENNDGGKAVAARAQRGEKYDLVMVDCFQSEGVVPESCRNAAFASNIKTILKPQGKLIQQVWAPQYKEMLATYQQAFGKENAIGRNAELDFSLLVIATAPGEAEP